VGRLAAAHRRATVAKLRATYERAIGAGALSDKITAYCLAVLAAHDLDSEQGVARVRQLLAPIDALRATQRANQPAKEESPEAPIPPLGSGG
jgi:hypothetical protein